MAREKKRFTDEQVERANAVDVVEYVRSLGLKVKKSGRWHNVQGQGGLYLNRSGNTWHCHSEGVGAAGAITLCMKLEDKTWLEAVKTLLGEEMEAIRHPQNWKPEPEPPKEFKLPPKNSTYKHVFAYLTKTRGIDSAILKEMVDKGHIYENIQKSCVFVGRDAEGTPKHASVRSTNTEGKVFKQDVPGSQKAFSFSISGTSGILNVFEAPIDALSYMSMQKLYGKNREDSYISLGGVMDKALEQYLKDHKGIEKIRVCTDNDSLLNASEWEISQTLTKRMFIKKNKVVKGKETDSHILFRTLNDYSIFVEKNENADVYYISLPKNKLHFSEDNELYDIEINAMSKYKLYKSIEDFEKGKGLEVSGKALYLKHFFEMPAGEKAAFRIYEKYAKDYKVTRHKPEHKDFNEDLIAIRQREATKDIEEKRRLSENDILKQAGINVNTIKWYEGLKEHVPFNSWDFNIKGSCEMLIVCDSPKEIFSYIDIQIRNFKSYYNVDYIPEEYYIPYTDTSRLQEYLEKNPEIKKVWICTSRTERGKQAAEEIMKVCGEKMFCHREAPKLNRFAEDLENMNEIRAVLEQNPSEQQMEQEVEVEM